MKLDKINQGENINKDSRTNFSNTPGFRSQSRG